MFGDIYNTKGRLKTIDKELDITYKERGNYVITHKGQYFMSCKTGDLGDNIIKQVREVVYINNHKNIYEEADKHNNKLEKSKDRDLKNLNESFAREIVSTVKRL